MELRALQVLVAVADHGSVARAASALHLSASAVSHNVTKLEAELGTQLFHRLPRGMALSAAGEAFLAPARRALREADAAAQAVAAVEGLVAGHLHVVALRMFTALLADAIAAFAGQHPRVMVIAHRPQGDVGVDQLVRSGECEVGVMRRIRASDELEVTALGHERLVVIVAESHPLAGRPSVTLRELGGQRFVAPPAGSPLRGEWDLLFQREQVVPDVVVEADHQELMVELARTGAVLALSSETSATPVLQRGARAIPLDPPERPELALVTRRGPLSPAAAAFRQIAVGLVTS